jgi:hypothetical protein
VNEKKEENLDKLIFGTKEWNKKYKIKNEKKEEKKQFLNSLVNETIKKKENDENVISLNEKVNNITYCKQKPLKIINK